MRLYEVRDFFLSWSLLRNAKTYTCYRRHQSCFTYIGRGSRPMGPKETDGLLVPANTLLIDHLRVNRSGLSLPKSNHSYV